MGEIIIIDTLMVTNVLFCLGSLSITTQAKSFMYSVWLDYYTQ